VPKTLEQQLRAGLGPDIIIGLPYGELPRLADAGLLQEINPEALNLNAFVPQHIEGLTYNGKLYALPFMASTPVLFYNKTAAMQPPDTLSELVDVARSGSPVAIQTGFEQAFWGIAAFGGYFFTEQGYLATTPTEYADWFGWLANAQQQSGVIMDDDLDLLIEKFIQGDVAYLIAPVSVAAQLTDALGEQALGAAPIPGVEYLPDPEDPENSMIRSAGPLLNLQVIAFSKAANANSVQVGVELAQFLNNPTVQRKLILNGVEHAPTNLRVFIRPDLSEVGNALVRQSRTGVVVPLDRLVQFRKFGEAANTIYINLLEGGLTPQDAAEQLSEQFLGSIGGQ
jgi:maltose-binding protein MalE